MMTTTSRLLIALALLPVAAVATGPTDSPEQAIQRLEAAYRAKDIEAAVGAKDFRSEARLMLQDLAKEGRPDLSGDAEVLRQTAELLELAYRKEMKESGFPDLAGVECSFAPHEVLTEALVVVHENCRFPDGAITHQRINVAKTSAGWRVLNPLD